MPSPASANAPQPCALRLVFKVKQHAVKLDAGTIVRYAERLTIRNVEEDVTRTSVLRDDTGAFLIGSADWVRPTVWDADLWPELSLAIEPGTVCQDPQFPEVHRLRFTLGGPNDDRCALEAATARCCTFGGQPHLVLAPDAARTTGPTPRPDGIRVMVARPGTLVPQP